MEHEHHSPAFPEVPDFPMGENILNSLFTVKGYKSKPMRAASTMILHDLMLQHISKSSKIAPNLSAKIGKKNYKKFVNIGQNMYSAASHSQLHIRRFFFC
jgi:hypothetical protein